MSNVAPLAVLTAMVVNHGMGRSKTYAEVIYQTVAKDLDGIRANVQAAVNLQWADAYAGDSQRPYPQMPADADAAAICAYLAEAWAVDADIQVYRTPKPSQRRTY